MGGTMWMFRAAGPAMRTAAIGTIPFIRTPRCLAQEGDNPSVPQAPTNYNPVGFYRKEFTVKPSMLQDNGRVLISFQGVESAYYVYVNGHEVGYSEDSYRPHEFDITDYLNPQGEVNTPCS